MLIPLQPETKSAGAATFNLLVVLGSSWEWPRRHLYFVFLLYVRLAILVSRKWDCIPVDRKLLPYFLLLLALSSKCVLMIVVPRHPLLEHLINGNQKEFSNDMCRLTLFETLNVFGINQTILKLYLLNTVYMVSC